jgi:uncharacterized protein
MPSNVSLEFAQAQKKYDAAVTPEQKLTALLEMKSTAPTHKGAENLRAEVNRKIAALKSSMERQRTQQAKKGSAPNMYVKKDGVGQVAIIGPPNSGKSWLLNKLVGMKVVEEAPYPFSTIKPEPGMMDYYGGRIQLVEIPAIVEGSSEGKAQGREILGMVRNADAIIVVSPKYDEKMVVNELLKSHIILNKERPKIIVKHSEFQGIQISGKNYLNFPVEQLEGYLKSVGFANSSVIISGNITSLTDVSQALDERTIYKKAISFDSREITDHQLLDLRDRIFLLLDKILIYTKKPGREAEMNQPLSLPKGSTVEALAKHLHKDFARKLKFAKVWGSTKFPGQRVGPDYILKNKDIVEISI